MKQTQTVISKNNEKKENHPIWNWKGYSSDILQQWNFSKGP